MRKIAVVTGTRAEYGILKLVLRAIETNLGLELLLVVTGMHLSHEFGNTIDDIIKDGFKISTKVDMLPVNDTSASMAKSVGQGIIGMVDAWEQLKPDIILVLGDRVEPLAATIAGVYMNIPVAHIHGGDRSKAGIDEFTRHAVTKLAHIHFPATKKSAERIIKMGEESWRVHTVGSPALDDILNESIIPPHALAVRFKINLSKPVILVLQHPVTTQVDEATKQMRETLDAIVEVGCTTIIIYPNADAGGRGMIELIKEYENYHFITTFKNLPRKEYIGLLRVSSVLVGNSSSGIIDAPSFGLPVVNIGIRQDGRERGNNVIDVEHDKGKIVEAIDKAITDKELLKEVRSCESPYGDGKASERIAELLGSVEITPQLLQKRITY